MATNKFSEKEVTKRILELYTGKDKNSLRRRVHVLYNLARQNRSGIIVQIGVGYGYGAFALAAGVSSNFMLLPRIALVFGIDDYSPKPQWPGEDYDGLSYWGFVKGRRAVLASEAHIYLINDDPLEVAKRFTPREVGLLYIESASDVRKVFDAWKPMVEHGGIVVLRDTLDRALGCDTIAADAITTGHFALYSDFADDYFIMLQKAL